MNKKDEIKEEYVLVFPTKILEEAGRFQGFNPNAKPYIDLILKKENTKFIKRENAENDPSYKQLIPYVILKYNDTYYTYQRGKLLSEKRLLGNYSLGIGGHISICDKNLFSTKYEDGLNREVFEEIKLNSKFSNKLIGVINDDTNKVGKVHFGVIHIFELENNDVTPKEKSINNTSFMTKEKLIEKINLFENWSQIFIKYIINNNK